MTEVNRRQFLKITGATLAGSSLALMGFSPLVIGVLPGGSASSNEVGYLTHKVVRSLGVLAFDNQARV
jgi:hypothetical protein